MVQNHSKSQMFKWSKSQRKCSSMWPLIGWLTKIGEVSGAASNWCLVVSQEPQHSYSRASYDCEICNLKQFVLGYQTTTIICHNCHISGMNYFFTEIKTNVRECFVLFLLQLRVRPRCFDQVGHETIHPSSGNKHFFTKSCHRQTYQNYEQPPQTYQNSDFQSHFSVLKIGWIFPKKNSVKNIGLGDQLLIKNVFWKLWFKKKYLLKMFPYFVGSVHNFVKSESYII